MVAKKAIPRMEIKPHCELPTVNTVACEPLSGLGVNLSFHFLLETFPKFYDRGLLFMSGG